MDRIGFEEMHELSIAENIVNIVQENLRGTGLIRSVKIKVGELATVIPDSLEFCFSAVTNGTILENAKLDIEIVPIVAHCENCGTNSEIQGLSFRCKKCGGADVEIVSGNELQVVEIELDDNVREKK